MLWIATMWFGDVTFVEINSVNIRMRTISEGYSVRWPNNRANGFICFCFRLCKFLIERKRFFSVFAISKSVTRVYLQWWIGRFLCSITAVPSKVMFHHFYLQENRLKWTQAPSTWLSGTVSSSRTGSTILQASPLNILSKFFPKFYPNAGKSRLNIKINPSTVSNRLLQTMQTSSSRTENFNLDSSLSVVDSDHLNGHYENNQFRNIDVSPCSPLSHVTVRWLPISYRCLFLGLSYSKFDARHWNNNGRSELLLFVGK